MAARALPGSVMAPVFMILFTIVVGRGSPFFATSATFAVCGVLLYALRIWIMLRCKRLPDTAPVTSWRRAFAAATLVNMLVMSAYTGLGVYILGVGLVSGDVLPRDVCVSQMPSRLSSGDRHYRCKYIELQNRAVHSGGLLVVIDDVTDSVRRSEFPLRSPSLASASSNASHVSSHVA